MNRETDIHSAISDEACRIEEDALHSAKGHFNAGAAWSFAHYLLGLPVAVLAAVAGIKAFTEDPVVAAWLAIGAAVLGAMNAFINPNDKAARHRSAGRELNALKNEARRFRQVFLPLADPKVAGQQLEVLARKHDQLNHSSPDIPRFAYEKTVKDIAEGRANYDIDGTK